MGIPEAQVGMRVLGPLEGELLAVQASDGQRLLTRHPLIAERAILNEQRWAPEDIYLYYDLFQALADLMRRDPLNPQKKLLTLLPLILIRQGRFNEARQSSSRAPGPTPRMPPPGRPGR